MIRAVLLALALLSAPALAQDDYTEFVKRVQIALHLHGFDPGPVNGADEGPTQAALARFQLSRNLPASGSMDPETLKILGVSREVPAQEAAEEENASAGSGMPLAKP
jgi:peptidoglycan hydrolase-like protein with peptidoglycan-binding domain